MTSLYYSNNKVFLFDNSIQTIWILNDDYHFEYFCTLENYNDIENIYYLSDRLFIYTKSHQLYFFDKNNTKRVPEKSILNIIQFDNVSVKNDSNDTECERFIDDNISDCFFSEKSGNLFYHKNNEIYLISLDKTVNEMLNLNFSVETLDKTYYSRYLISFPFEIGNIRFLSNVIEFEANRVKNIIIPDTLKWIYYENHLDDDYEYLYYRTFPIIILKTKDKIYSIGTSIKLTELNIDDVIANENVFILRKENTTIIFRNEEDLVSISHDLSKYIIDAVKDCYIINNAMFDTIITKDNEKYFNIAKIKEYFISGNSIIGLMENNQILKYSILSNKISYIDLNEDEKFHKILKDSILIEKNGKYYKMSHKQLEFSLQPIEIIYVSKTDSIYDTEDFDNDYCFTIDLKKSKLNQLLNLCLHFPVNETIKINISYSHMRKYISTGYGVTRDFFDDVCKELLYRYFIMEGKFTRFNKEQIDKLTEEEAHNLGYVINLILYNNGKFNFHFPLNFLEILTNKKLKFHEMEYFIRQREPEVYKLLVSIKNHPDKIKETGYGSYADCLKSLCKYEEWNNNIIQWIVDGFLYFYSSEYFKLNNCTTDAVLTDSRISVEDFMGKLKIEENKKVDYSKFRKTFETFLMSLSKEEFRILLKNWSGSSNTIEEEYYVFFVENENVEIKFAACCNRLQIDIRMLDDLDILFDILKTPYLTMVD